jgi:tetratricopeptide (TPR) repeat protein
MRARGFLWPWWVVLLAACAETPPRSAPPPEAAKATTAEVAVASAIAAHRKQAERDAAAGDLAAAQREWRILALLAPGNPQFRAQEEATRAAIEKGVVEQLQSANTALRAGDIDRAGAALLKALALDPGNVEAMKSLREIDRQRLARIQGTRAARASQAANGSAGRSAAASATPADASESYDIDQRIEMFRAGDLEGGLKELRAFVDANPNNQAARERIAATVYERGREAEAKGAREQALMLIDQASALRGKPLPEWTAQAQKLRKGLSDEYYDRGMQAYRTDTAAAIRLWEASLRYDPDNRKAAAKLSEARVTDDKLKRIQQETKLP